MRDARDARDALIYDAVDQERGLASDDDDGEAGEGEGEVGGAGLARDPAFRAPRGVAATATVGAGPGAGSLTLWEVVRSKDGAVRHGLRTIVLAQVFQQLSGINAVMYFSVGILSKINPGSAKSIALAVTAVNVCVLLLVSYGRRSAPRRAVFGC